MIAIGAILLVTVGLNYLIEVLLEGEWSMVVALLVASLISAGVAAIIWRVASERSNEETREPTPAERSPVEEEDRPDPVPIAQPAIRDVIGCSTPAAEPAGQPACNAVGEP